MFIINRRMKIMNRLRDHMTFYEYILATQLKRWDCLEQKAFIRKYLKIHLYINMGIPYIMIPRPK